MLDRREEVLASLEDREYRHEFVSEHINVGLAFQIRALRQRQKLTQARLAELTGSRQPTISEWENPSYGKYTLETLKELGKAFDVGLLVRFVRFGELVNWTVDLTQEAIAPPNFGEEKSQIAKGNQQISVKDISVDANAFSIESARIPWGTFDSPQLTQLSLGMTQYIPGAKNVSTGSGVKLFQPVNLELEVRGAENVSTGSGVKSTAEGVKQVA